MANTVTQDRQQLVEHIASALEETNPSALQTIHRLIDVAGPEFAQVLLAETLEVERGGGMMLKKHKRRRTPGGVFFYLARGKLPRDQRLEVFPQDRARRKPSQQSRSEDAPQAVQMDISDEARRLAENVGGQLRSADPARLETIARLVQVGGAELAEKALEDTLDIEEQGGTRKRDGARRSPGGTFLYIASRRLTEEQRQMVWPALPEELLPRDTSTPAHAADKKPASKPPVPAGTATTAKLMLVGQPASVQKRQGYVEFELRSSKAPTLPKGLPAPGGGSVFTVYVGAKQWKKVAAAASNPQDALILEGYPVIDDQSGKAVLFASNVTSKLIQRAKQK